MEALLDNYINTRAYKSTSNNHICDAMSVALYAMSWVKA